MHNLIMFRDMLTGKQVITSPHTADMLIDGENAVVVTDKGRYAILTRELVALLDENVSGCKITSVTITEKPAEVAVAPQEEVPASE